MRKLSRWIPILGVAVAGVAGGIIALVIAGTNGTTKTVTTTVVQQAAPTSEPTAFASSGAAGKSINQIYAEDAPGVVDIEVIDKPTSGNSLGNLFGGGGQQQQGGEGAGVVYDSSGDILTDEHVVDNAQSVKVTFQDGKTFPAKVVGTDPSSDVGVIKVQAPSSELHPIPIGNSDSAKVGDPVVAIGSPFGLPETVTSGIVSQTGRLIKAPNVFTITNAIQTDAAINPGNSGGPLLNADGQVIGLNDQIETDTSSATGQGQNAGIGFATPINEDVAVAKALIAGTTPQHAYIGIHVTGADNQPAKAQGISPTGPAGKGGMKSGDVITKVDSTPITSGNQFIETLGNYKPGQTITVTVNRNGQVKTLKITLSNRPDIAPTQG